jgi:hypothetical protein
VDAAGGRGCLMTPTEVLAVKAAVRERDNHCCAECGLTADEHYERYGQGLAVHRVVPGSAYTVQGCVTLCRACHKGKPKSEPIPGNAADLIQVRAEPAWIDRVNAEAERLGLSLSAYIRLAVNERLERTAPAPAPGHKRRRGGEGGGE